MGLLKKLLTILSKKEKKILIILLLVSVFISFLETFSVSFIMLFASVATNFDLITQKSYYKIFYNFFGCSSPVNFVLLLGFLLLVFYVFRAIANIFFSYGVNRFSQGRFKRFSCLFFKNYLNFAYKDFTATNSSNISKIVFTDSSQITAIVNSVLTIGSELLTVFFIYLTLIWINWKMTVVLTLMLSVKIFFIIKTFSSRLTLAGENTQKLNVQLTKTWSESFGNFKLIKLLSNEKYILDRFQNSASGFIKANVFNNMLQNIPRIILELVGFSLLISIIMYVLYMYNNASAVIPVVSMYAFAFYRFLPSVNKILAEYNRVLFCKPSIDAIKEYLEKNLEILGEEKVCFKDKIEIKNLSFAYLPEKNILKNINIIINKGESVAFIGESGSGKSTFVDIIMGLYKPTIGNISIDNKILTENNIKSWRAKIGYIPQQIYLFDGSIADNIAFGRDYNESKVIEVLKRANLYDFLISNGGIHVRAGEGGVLLSGGQRQRVAIARALYSDPEILVLDEATSALDNQTEEKIMQEIYSLNKDKTLIIVAHRLSTVERCEKIYKIEKGMLSKVDDLYNLHDKDNIESINTGLA